MDLQKLTSLQKEILSGGFGWQHYNRVMSDNSLRFGPEMVHVGTKYNMMPLRVLFLGINPHFNSYIDDEGNTQFENQGTPYWMKNDLNLNITQNGLLVNPNLISFSPDEFPVLLNEINMKYYMKARRKYQNSVKELDLYRNEYNIPKILDALYQRFSLPFGNSLQASEGLFRYHSEDFDSTNETGAQTFRRICSEFTAQRTALCNSFPFEGNGANGLILDNRLIPYGHIRPLIEVIKPHIVLIFHKDAAEFVERNLDYYNLEILERGHRLWLAAQNINDYHCLWGKIYHFSGQTSGHSPMQWFIDELLPMIYENKRYMGF